MKELLIIFVILLVLLMLISTFGGSIRQTETFIQAGGITQEESHALYVPKPALFEMPPMPVLELSPLPSSPPFDIPAPVVEPFDNFKSFATV